MSKLQKYMKYYYIILLIYCINLIIGSFFFGSFEFTPGNSYLTIEKINIHDAFIWFSPLLTDRTSNSALISLIIGLVVLVIFWRMKDSEEHKKTYLLLDSIFGMLLIVFLINSFTTKYFIRLPIEFLDLVPETRSYFEYYIDIDYNITWTIHLPANNQGLFLRYGLMVYVVGALTALKILFNGYSLFKVFYLNKDRLDMKPINLRKEKSTSLVEKLKKLELLLEENIITRQEYDRKRAKIIDDEEL